MAEKARPVNYNLCILYSIYYREGGELGGGGELRKILTFNYLLFRDDNSE